MKKIILRISVLLSFILLALSIAQLTYAVNKLGTGSVEPSQVYCTALTPSADCYNGQGIFIAKYKNLRTFYKGPVATEE